MSGQDTDNSTDAECGETSKIVCIQQGYVFEVLKTLAEQSFDYGHCPNGFCKDDEHSSRSSFDMLDGSGSGRIKLCVGRA